jgi:hydrogenase nickel incorporation protein HypB
MKIQIIRNVLEANEKLADQIRSRNNTNRTLMINMMSSPGSGKTALLERLIPILQQKGLKVAVIEGDITTTRDAERLQPLNIPIAQINTEPFGGDCHLGAEVIIPALETFQPELLDLVIIENVGNLVCPAEFDTGADFNLVVLSTTEGEDKPLKYPLMFRVSQLALISKMDLVRHLDFDMDQLTRNILTINPGIDIIPTSTKSGTGLPQFSDWLFNKLKK